MNQSETDARGVNSDQERLRNSNGDQRDSDVNVGHGTKSSGLIDSLLGHFRDKPRPATPIAPRRTEGQGTHRISTSTERHSQSRSSIKQQQNKKSQTSRFSSSLPWTKKKESSELRGCVVQNQIENSAGSRNGDNCLSEVILC